MDIYLGIYLVKLKKSFSPDSRFFIYVQRRNQPGRSDDVTGQVFHCRIIFWRYAVAAEDMEPNTGNGGLRKVSAARCDKNE
jgi:hypothetical protein